MLFEDDAAASKHSGVLTVCKILQTHAHTHTHTHTGIYIYIYIYIYIVGRNSAVGIATRYGDRIPVGAKFSAPVQNGPGAQSASCTMGTVSFLEVKRPGRGVDHPEPRLKKE